MLATDDPRYLGPFNSMRAPAKKDELVGFLESAVSDRIDGPERDLR
jgi:hypothetical protein